uniref:PPM-type phosphatase domain-containing protein n=1 Tax=Panagrellus redivivus TaxID=6233 RepID=A0A7E4VMT8_PANRE
MALKRSLSDQRLFNAANADDQSDPSEPGPSSKYLTLGNRKHAKTDKLTQQQRLQWLASRTDNGLIRLHRPSGIKHLIIPVTTQTTAQEICQQHNLDPLFLRIGHQRIKQLTRDNRPLQMQNEILMTLGYSTIQECINIGSSGHLTHIFCFFTGRPLGNVYNNISNVLLVAHCYVGRGRLLQKWAKKRCILYNDTIRIENESVAANGIEGDEDNILQLNKFKIELADSNHGRCLKMTSSSQKICFVFEDPSDLQQWSTHATQCSIVPNCDLSDRQLIFLPDKLFYVGSQRMITSLNLRRNSLLIKPSNTTGSPLIGWLDDVARFPSLRTLNIADNCLHTFPHAVIQLTALCELNLSGNRISILPGNIRMLFNLTTLNLGNNWLTTLPRQLIECQHLTSLDLSFNRFQHVPEVLFHMPKLNSWELAGNYVNNLNVEVNTTISIGKIDLRLNTFERPLRLTSFLFDSITILDLRRAGAISELDLSNLVSIQVIYCSYLRLKTIQVNGSNLREFYASNNELTQVVVMPVPHNLTILSVDHNKLESLPEWVTDLNRIVTISAHHNLLTKLPYRILMNVHSLRHLLVGNNKLTKLPDIVENCSIEVMNVENNFIQKLPVELFKSAHQLRHLNLTNNRLLDLPAPNAFFDLNRLQTLRLSGNQLSETCMHAIVACRRLRLLDISYNQFRFFNDSALSQLTLLEEINISGNRLTSLSTELAQLLHLQVLRAHSNKISSIPDLSFSKSLKTIDLSNNRLAKIKVEYCVAEKLKFLDLTCNPFSMSAQPLEIKSERRAISVVDISKKSALSNIQFGFSETTGQKSKLSTRQIRPKDWNDITFAIIDGGSNPEISELVKFKLGHQLEVPNRENPETLRRAILRTHEDIGEKGIRLGASVFVLRIVDRQIMCARSGHTSAILIRKDGEVVYLLKEQSITSPEEYERLRLNNAIITADGLINGVCTTGTSVGYTFLYPAVVPNPGMKCVDRTDEDDFIVIGNRVLWKNLTEREIIEAVRRCSNPLQAAKRLQDMCQAHEQLGNISIIVIKFLNERPLANESTMSPQPMQRQKSFFSKNTPSASPSNKSNDLFTARPAHVRSFSEQRSNEIALRNIEDRLEKISVAINRIDSDSSGVYYVNPPSGSTDKASTSASAAPRVSVRRLKDGQHRSLESRMSINITESQSHTPVPSQGSNLEQIVITRPFSSSRSSSGPSIMPDLTNFNDYSPQPSENSEESALFNQERFQEVRNRLQQDLRLDPRRIQPNRQFRHRHNL